MPDVGRHMVGSQYRMPVEPAAGTLRKMEQRLSLPSALGQERRLQETAGSHGGSKQRRLFQNHRRFPRQGPPGRLLQMRVN